MNLNLIIFIAILAVATSANAKFFPTFPWFECDADEQSPYSLEPFRLVRNNGTATSNRANTYCSKLHVEPVVGCNHICCKFDLFKIAFDAYPSCRVSGARVSATVNGVAIPTPYFEAVKDAPPNSTLLRVPKLGLTLKDDGAEICITLGLNSKGEGCNTLESLCRTAPGVKPGVCSISYIDSNFECCPSGTPMEANPPEDGFPFCNCNKTAGVTNFNVKYDVQTLPGRAPGKTTMYCFDTDVSGAIDPSSPCGKTTTLKKAEFYANDALRRNVRGIMLRPSGAASYTFRSAIWGPVGNNTLKATNVNWTREQAKGGQICIELDSPVDINSFCEGDAPGTCKVALFDDSFRCCPAFSTAL